MKTLLILLAIMVTGCTEQAQQEVQSSNRSVSVELLTEFDGCKLYRIYDGRNVYMAKCGDTVTTSTKQGCGKNCTYTTSDMTINDN